MFDRIDPRSPTPLYAQIAARIRLAIAADELRPGDGLPSVRQLAGQLRINPATVVQAYRDLAAEGFVEMRQGAGTFVHLVPTERRSRERESAAKRLVQDMMREAVRIGITADELRLAVDRELNGHAELVAAHGATSQPGNGRRS
jgi:GntR family transcriptional regulator